MEINIKPLDSSLVNQANMNSMNGNRGYIRLADYKSHCDMVMEWSISDEKKQKILDQLYTKYSEIMRHEAQHVSVAVAGPAGYNPKKLDHGDTILRLSSELSEWFKDVERQVMDVTKPDDKRERLLRQIAFADSYDKLDPVYSLAELATVDNAKFIELFESMVEKYRWRKNSAIYKLYLASKEGKVKEIRREVFFEDGNLMAYIEGDRAYIKFTTRPARQLMVAMKSRGWWWNSGKRAWSTYLDRLDKEWVSGISTQYAKYV